MLSQVQKCKPCGIFSLRSFLSHGSRDYSLNCGSISDHFTKMWKNHASKTEPQKMIFAPFFPTHQTQIFSRTLISVFVFNPWALESPMKGLYLIPKCCLCSPIQFSSLSLPQPRFMSPLPSYEPHWFVLGKTYPWSMCWARGWGWQNGGMKTIPSFLPIRKPKRRTQNTSLGIENRVSKVTYHEFGYLRELVLIKREILLIKGNQAPMMYVL